MVVQGKLCFQGKRKLLKNPECKNQARNQGGGAFEAFVAPKFSKFCMATLTFVETFKE